MVNKSDTIDSDNIESTKKSKGVNSIIWAIAGFIVLFVFGIGDFYFGLLAPEPNLPVLLISLSMAVLGSLFFFWLGRLYIAGKKLAVYSSLFLISTALVLPIIQGPAEGDMDLLVGLVTYYAPGAYAVEPLRSVIPSLAIFYLLIANISWITLGIIGLLIGQIIDLINKRLRKR